MIIMNSKKNIIINAAIIGSIIVGFIVVNFITNEPSPKTVSFENVGIQTPLIPLNDSAGSIGSLKEYRGQNILIHFWASWCEACAADQKAMEQINKSYHGNSSVKIIGIASSDKLDAINKSGLIKNSTIPQFLEETGNLALALGVKSLPQTILIDSKGRILFQLARPIDPKQVEQIENRINSLSQTNVPSFVFQTSSGKPLDQSTLANKIWVADFIFTSCSDMCPMQTSKMRILQELFKKDERFRLVSISVDPENDTLEVMKAYEKKHNFDPSMWFFLRGKIDSVKELLVNGFKLGTMDKPEFHSGKFVLINQLNKIQGYYDPDSAASFEELKADITKLLLKK